MEDHKSLQDYKIDDDYIDVEPERADISIEPPDDQGHRSVDVSHTFMKDKSGMSGSIRDVQIDEQVFTERDNRDGAETGMDINEADGYYGKTIIRDGKRRTRAEWLYLLHNGYRSKTRMLENERMDNQRWIDTFTARLELTDYQKKRVERLIDSVNMTHFGPYTVEFIVLAAIVIVCNEDDRWVGDEETYHKLVKASDGSLRAINNCRNLLREKSDLLG